MYGAGTSGRRDRCIMTAHRDSLPELIAQYARYVHLPDYDVVTFATGIAVTAHMKGDPTWGSIIAAPSSAKTETVRLLGDTADEEMDEITAAGLLSWLPGKTARETGLLARHKGRVFATIADLSTILATSDRGMRDVLFSLLRRAYDGQVVRELGGAPRPLRWQGRLTLLAAATPLIDHYSSHTNALGPRWIYFRLPDLAAPDARRAAQAARRHTDVLDARRAEARATAARVVRSAANRLCTVETPAWVGTAIDDAALVACAGRATVERWGYGKREITALPSRESPARLAGQLHRLAHALLALGVDPATAAALSRRVALDTVPETRRVVLATLAGGEALTTSQVARRAACHRHVAGFALEELAAIGVAIDASGRTETDHSRARAQWRLDGPDAPLITHVFSQHDGTKSGGQPPNPQDRASGGRHRHFVPPQETAQPHHATAPCEDT